MKHNIKTIFETLLKELKEALYFKDERYFLPKEVETKALQIYADYKDEIYLPENFSVVKPVDDIISLIFEGVIVQGRSSLYDGQTTYNASSDECNLVYTFPQYFEFGGLGKEDHECHHTGEGYSGADLKLLAELSLTAINMNTQEEVVLRLPKGFEIDAKIYKYLSDTWEGDRFYKGAVSYLNENFTGSLGHFGNGLLMRIKSESSQWYYASNIPGAIPFRIKDFNVNKKYPYIKVGRHVSGLLTVEFTEH